MATIVTRAGKGLPLTHNEVDANFTNLNTDKLETSGGTLTGNLSFGDNDKAIFGAGSDLQIWHDGSHARLRETTGDFRIQTTSGGVNALVAKQNAEVEIAYAGSTKLATTATGVDVTGTVTADGLTVDGNVDINGSYVAIGDGTLTTQVALIAGTASNSTLDFGDAADGNIGRIEYEHTNDAMTFRTNNSERLRITSSGNVGIGTSSPSRALDVVRSGADFAQIGATTGTGGSAIRLQNDGGTAGLYLDNSTGSGFATGAYSVNLYNSAAVPTVFWTNNTERARIDASGNLLVGLTSSTDGTNVGCRVRGDGFLAATREGTSGQPTVIFNKKTNDGAIAYFQKDGTTVGSIGTATNELEIKSSGSRYLELQDIVGLYNSAWTGNLQMTPTVSSVDLGNAFNRWDNLYLSGLATVGTAVAATNTASATGTVTLNFSTSQNHVLTLTGNVTLANPTTEQVGQSGFIVFIQDATGGRTVSLGTDYETAGGAGLTLSSAANATDMVPYIVAASGRILLGTPQLAFA